MYFNFASFFNIIFLCKNQYFLKRKNINSPFEVTVSRTQKIYIALNDGLKTTSHTI